MVGIFSRFTGGRSGHRRSQSAIDLREPLPHSEVASSAPATAAHGIEIAVEFKPVERPTEPLDHDQPVKCPLPEPSILNDGRTWKERMTTANGRVRSDLPVVKEGSQLEPEPGGTRPRPAPAPRKQAIMPALSAPESNLVNLLEECNVAAD